MVEGADELLAPPFCTGRWTEYGLDVPEVLEVELVPPLNVWGGVYPVFGVVGAGASVGPGVTVVLGAGTQPGGQEPLGILGADVTTSLTGAQGSHIT
ncbi:MAG: hypothetical protein NZ899_01715 [Thermoguttaceae bacterium]|nr:hypothetical protein [Thermoguttaceae bacterium]MDW8078653.1 hypothetical protein [Thermoguttaceae bacterium]